jgi:hypothetical protein
MNKKIVINGITGEVVERDFTADELQLIEADKLEAIANAKIVADKATAKQAVLTKLGLTADEAQLLLGA